MSVHYRVKRRCFKLLHYVVIISIKIAHMCIISFTKDTVGSNNFAVLNILH